MSNAVPIYEAKNKLPLYIHKAEEEGPVFLSRRNKDVAVILSMAEYESLLQKIKAIRNNMTFLERVQDFKERNKDLYSDREIDEIFENARYKETRAFNDETNIWDGIMEDADD